MPLNPTAVLDAAVDYLDEVGLDAFSARRLAERLGVRIGALYWHYPSKQALLDAIVERIADDAAAAGLPDAPWPEQLRAFADTHRAAMLAHTDGARLLAEMRRPGPRAVDFVERPAAVLQETGLAPWAAAAAVDTLTSYVNGFTIEEQARKLHQPKAERDTAFGFGVAVVIDGLRSRVPPG